MNVKGFIYFEGGPADGWRKSIAWGIKKVLIPEFTYDLFNLKCITHVYAKTDRYQPGIGRVFTHLGDKSRL